MAARQHPGGESRLARARPADEGDGAVAECDRIGVEGAATLDLARARALLDAWPCGSWDDEASQRLYRVALLRAASAGHFLRKATGSNA